MSAPDRARKLAERIKEIVARRLGITLTVLQSMGRDTKMVVFRENGPPEDCEDAMAALRDDLRIESIERR